MINKIHQTPEEKQAALRNDNTVNAINETTGAVTRLHASVNDRTDIVQGFKDVSNKVDKTASAVDELKDYIDHPEVVVKKLEEIKSASLITNKHLKSIEKSGGETQKVQILGAELVTIKGEKGDKGDVGEDSTVAGPKGDRGNDGVNGKDGRNGIDGHDGLSGKDGISGSPDTPEEVVEKVNTSSKKIKSKQVEGLSSLINSVDQLTNYPVGKTENVSGSSPLVIKNSGTRVSDFVTELDFSTGLTASYSNNGKVTVTGPLGTTVDLTSEVTGTLPVANGGTGASSYTAGSVLFSNGSTIAQDNANFNFNDTTNTLTVGGNSSLLLAIGGGATPDAINIGSGGTIIGQVNGSAAIRSGFAGKTISFKRASDGEINHLFDFDGTSNSYLAALGGNVGIGTTSPTAALHLPAGTATANTAPLKLTSGTNLTTIENGAVEYNGTDLTIGANSGRTILNQKDKPFKSTYYYNTPVRAVYTGTLAQANEQASLFDVTKTTAFDRITIEVTTAGSVGSLIRLGIYNTDSGGFPSTLVLDAGTVDSTTTGVKSITITQTLAPGLYCLVACAQGAPVSDPVVRMGNALLIPPQPSGTTYIRTVFTQYAITGAFATFTASPGIASGDMPFIQLRAA